MNTPNADIARDAARQDNGRFGQQHLAEAPDVDLFDLRQEAQQTADRLRLEADAHAANAHRIEAYSLLKDYPDDFTIATTIWPEDTNDDNTFDVNLGRVFDEEGTEVENFEGEPGAIPAGWDDGLHSRTSFDAWRVDPDNVYSPISVRNMKAWFASYTGDRAVGVEKKADNVERARGEIIGLAVGLRLNGSGASGTSRKIGNVEVGVSYHALKDVDGFTKPRGSCGDFTLTNRTEHRTFVFGQPGDPENFESYEAALDATAEVLAEWNG